MENRAEYDKSSPCRLLVISASLRTDSLNTKLAKFAARSIEKNGGIVDYANLSEFEVPAFNQDLEANNFHPKGAEELKKRLLASDAFIISSPEYNASMPGNLKNLIDWTSRFRPQPFNEKQCLLMSASPSMAGGNRGLWSLRIPLEHLGARVYPDMFSLASAHTVLNAEGNLSDPTLAKRFEANILSFMHLVESSKNYHWMKEAWVEFLGEKTDRLTERTE